MNVEAVPTIEPVAETGQKPITPQVLFEDYIQDLAKDTDTQAEEIIHLQQAAERLEMNSVEYKEKDKSPDIYLSYLPMTGTLGEKNWYRVFICEVREEENPVWLSGRLGTHKPPTDFERAEMVRSALGFRERRPAEIIKEIILFS